MTIESPRSVLSIVVGLVEDSSIVLKSAKLFVEIE